ncbi:D-ribose pyranase [Breznakiella homolactica]|uniref:D-ribose pyranase n=1 Tax=Breznakiella homolactica TaxID=2798577 RepID=A0A7T7XN19_9SPIR|nr:D-ribose pyranase [Breznakiella homolactica]QQO09375.1 D-ribose pyranase [Breznakiella homolactica]
MKKSGILNPAILEVVASLGHTQYLVLCDAGLPIPPGKKVIDISLTSGIPSFMDVLNAVLPELAVESYIAAGEITAKNPELYSALEESLKGVAGTSVPHEEFKKITERAVAFIRTGECSPYANIILVGGVNF